MKTHTVTLTLQVRAATTADAVDIGLAAGSHLLETFNDDGTLSAPVRVMAGPVAVMRRQAAARVLSALLKCEAPRPVKLAALRAVDTLRQAIG